MSFAILYQGFKAGNFKNNVNDLVLNLTLEKMTRHSRIVTTIHKGSLTSTKEMVDKSSEMFKISTKLMYQVLV